MAVDFTLPEGGWDTGLNYWLAAVNDFAYSDAGGFPTELAAVPGPCTFGVVSLVVTDPLGLTYSTNLKCWWFDYGEWLVLAFHGVQGAEDFFLSSLAYPQALWLPAPGAVHPVWGY